MTHEDNGFGGFDMGRLLPAYSPPQIDTSVNDELYEGLAEAAREKHQRAERIAADTSLTAQALVQLNEHQQKLNDKQRIEQKVQRRIARIQAKAIRKFNIATIWLSAVAAVGTGFAVVELGRTFGWW